LAEGENRVKPAGASMPKPQLALALTAAMS
jgi:hypothetical protein